ncbi:5'-nucleotidase, lipoprotein e(P4) family [Paludifilum halophilum]|uniref:5'-nucleotidase, lipoprotein e(P4) family n=1 Tax=Paludifilum halophilum TaxID=1642702 RepID=A0A235B3I1_9BACL|nr:5'-nucleotidase, lipoprotein e(P4) family [Paludifilum halophilum]OYD06792.1 5'-nucleotidase, lipoprotein e(P4) family [Paludifilum halophilum]
MKKRRLTQILILMTALLLVAVGCANHTENGKNTDGENQADPDPNPAKKYEMAVLYQQKSAEAHALQVQAYNMAKKRLDEYLENKKGDQKPAIVIDLDETVLDNTPHLAMGVKEGFDYTEWGEEWDTWVKAASADLIPGSKEFLNHADQKGVKIFYVSNRVVENEEATIKNLKKLDLPQATKDNVRLKGPSKKERRGAIKKENYDIALLIGDTLHDFSDEFSGESSEDRNAAVEKMKDEFGDRFIILPNPTYNEWTHAELESWK